MIKGLNVQTPLPDKKESGLSVTGQVGLGVTWYWPTDRGGKDDQDQTEHQAGSPHETAIAKGKVET